jgi:hypothetical protein
MNVEPSQKPIRLLEVGEEISPEWARALFPPVKRRIGAGLPRAFLPKTPAADAAPVIL